MSDCSYLHSTDRYSFNFTQIYFFLLSNLIIFITISTFIHLYKFHINPVHYLIYTSHCVTIKYRTCGPFTVSVEVSLLFQIPCCVPSFGHFDHRLPLDVLQRKRRYDYPGLTGIKGYRKGYLFTVLKNVGSQRNSNYLHESVLLYTLQGNL